MMSLSIKPITSLFFYYRYFYFGYLNVVLFVYVTLIESLSMIYSEKSTVLKSIDCLNISIEITAFRIFHFPDILQSHAINKAHADTVQRSLLRLYRLKH